MKMDGGLLSLEAEKFPWYADILLNSNKITQFKVDSGADDSLIENKLAKKLKINLRRTSTYLVREDS